MSPVRSNEAKLQGVFDSIWLGLAAQAGVSDPVVDALGAVFVADVEHDRFFSVLEEQSRTRVRSASDRADNISGDFTH